MTDRQNLKIKPGTYATLREQKRDGETWDDCLRRLAETDLPTTTVETERLDGSGWTREVEPDDSLVIRSDGPLFVEVAVDTDRDG